MSSFSFKPLLLQNYGIDFWTKSGRKYIYGMGRDNSDLFKSRGWLLKRPFQIKKGEHFDKSLKIFFSCNYCFKYIDIWCEASFAPVD